MGSAAVQFEVKWLKKREYFLMFFGLWRLTKTWILLYFERPNWGTEVAKKHQEDISWDAGAVGQNPLN